MRMHIELDDELVGRIDEVAGPRGRSGFVRQAVEAAVAQEERWRALESAFGAIPETGHDWDDDPPRGCAPNGTAIRDGPGSARRP